MKSLLILGASFSQMPMILKAKELGYRVITCDNTPSNPGHEIADEWYEINTLDMEAVLELARRLSVDGIGWTSDLAAPTAAWVSERLGLPGHPYSAIDTVIHKDKFRAFLAANGFRTPRSASFHQSEAEAALNTGFDYPLIVKPVDSSGSRGVTRLDGPERFPEALEAAFACSRSKRCAVEEFVEASGSLITGDVFSVDGKIVFDFYCDDYRDPVAPLYCICSSVPSTHSRVTLDKVNAVVERAFQLLGIRTGTYNFDIRVASDGEPVLMEINPRAGGPWIPQMAKLATGVDLFEASVRALVGDPLPSFGDGKVEGVWAEYGLHTLEGGRFDGLEIDPDFERDHVRQVFLKTQIGDVLKPYTGVMGVFGGIIMQFASRAEADEAIGNMRSLARVRIIPA